MFLFFLAADPAATTQQMNPLVKLLGGGGMLTPMLLIFGIFYFLMIRPQQKKQRDQDDWQKRVAPGDEVVTTGGLIGKVGNATEDTVTLEFGNTKIRVLRSHITGPAPGARAEKAAPASGEEKKA
jgi:preprotein translocase subunit YajC